MARAVRGTECGMYILWQGHPLAQYAVWNACSSSLRHAGLGRILAAKRLAFPAWTVYKVTCLDGHPAPERRRERR